MSEKLENNAVGEIEQDRDVEVAALVRERHDLQKEFAAGIGEPEPAWWSTYWGDDVDNHEWREEHIRDYETRLRANLSRTESLTEGMNPEEKARIEGVFDRGQGTVEVQSAYLYDRRKQALIDALKSSEMGAEEKERDLDVLDETRHLYEQHRVLKRQPGERLSPEEIEAKYREQNAVHNRLIDNLNRMNGLCQKYGVERLTYRNFLKSGTWDNKYPHLAGRWNDDRAIVEEYFYFAFKEESLEKRSEAFGKGLISGANERANENLFDDLDMPVELADDKEWVRMRKLVHLEKKRNEVGDQ